ncbi:MAG: sigma 54-interacting transcriptional regulator [Candidatus Limnocylindria bacterium]
MSEGAELMMERPTTIGGLREARYRSRPVKVELRSNLIAALAERRALFTGIVGYDATVLPQIENAILSGQDIMFLGERGQAKSRIARQLVSLLDPAVPAIAGCEINDDPFAPICAACRYRVANDGDDVEVVWLTPDQRYSEKLATPDISIADLIGEVDPIRVAEGRYLSDELTIHYGLLPRTHRGIFALNELPDLAERVQVGLLNVMEERDVQIRGYKVRLPLDLFVVASANPEDYTNRGRIITPLKDRFGSQIRTHYPREIATEVGIMEQERAAFADEGLSTVVPAYMKEVLAELSQLARRSPEISQRSGVSVRVTITNYENLVSNALKRTLRNGESSVVPRISDLSAIVASTAGKIELESIGDLTEERVIERLVQRSVLNVFNRTFSLAEFDSLLAAFQRGATMHVSPTLASQEYVKQALQIPGMKGAVAKVGATGNPAAVAAAVEFVLEGLHLNRKLNKERGEARSTFRA